MELSVICFTKNGLKIIEKLRESCSDIADVYGFSKCSALKEADTISYVNESLEEWTGKQFEKKRPIIFVGAAGIAVRASAPFVKNKLTDSAVIVMDEAGGFVIPILSGHIGGANELARLIAERTGALPVITTATDINRKFAVDLFAKRNSLNIVNKDGIARVSGKLLAGEEIKICSELEADEASFLAFEREHKGQLSFTKDEGADVYIGRDGEKAKKALLHLKPRQYVLGIGCRKNKSEEEIAAFVMPLLEGCGVETDEIDCVCSIDIKSREEGLLGFAGSRHLKLSFYSAEDLSEAEGDFEESEFVKETVGVGNVAQRAAVAAAGKGCEVILRKQKGDGVTAALTRIKRRLYFE